jgi:hypothetical protein
LVPSTGYIADHVVQAPPNGPVRVFYVDRESSTLVSASEEPRPLDADRGHVLGGLSLVTVYGRDYLYWVADDAQGQAFALRRAPLNADASLGPSETVDTRAVPLGFRPTALLNETAEGGLLMAYFDGVNGPAIARSADGIRFERLATLPFGGVMPHAAPLGDGTFAATFQRGAMEQMSSYVVRVWPTGRVSWPILVGPVDHNVHDTFVLPRPDGHVDLYFIDSYGQRGFSLFRRALHSNGTPGPIERLTTAALGNVQKPRAHRLQDGSVYVTFARVTGLSATGYPDETELLGALIQGDAVL